MLFLQGDARALGSAWLWVHLMLWTLETPLVSPQGELCRSWTSGMGDLDSSFQCPPSPDQEHLKFCCGTCRTPYCCYSEEDRLDQRLCSTYHQDEPTTDASNMTTTPAPYSRRTRWIYFFVGTITFLLFGVIICCFEQQIRNAFRRFLRWRQIRNRDHRDDPPPTIQDHQVDPPPSIQFPSGSVGSSPDGERSQHESGEDLQMSPTSNVPLVAESDHENAGYQNGQAQPYPSPTSEPGVAVGDGSSSHTSVPSTDPEEFYRSRPRVYALARDPTSSNDSEDSRGTRRRRTVSVGFTLPSSNESNLYRGHSLSYDSQVPIVGTRQTNPPAQPANLGYALPEHLTRSSPALYSDQPPHYNELFPPGTPVSLPTSASAQLGHVEVNSTGDGTQPQLHSNLDPALATGDPSENPPQYDELFPLGTPVSPSTSDTTQLGHAEANIPEDGGQPQPSGNLNPAVATGDPLDIPPQYGKLFPFGSTVSPSTLDTALLVRAESSIPEDGAQPQPTGPLDLSLATGGQSSSQACAVSLVPPPSEAQEPRGTSSQMSTQAERDSLRLIDYESLGARPRAPCPKRRVFPKSSIDYEALGARPRTSDPGRHGPPRRDDPEGSDGARPQSAASAECLPPSYDEACVTDRPPRRSTRADPSLVPEDPPPYDVAVSSDIESVPHASDRQSMGQTQHATAGAEESPVSPRPVIIVPATTVTEPDDLDLPR